MKYVFSALLCIFLSGCDYRQNCASDISILAQEASVALARADAISLRSAQERMRAELANCGYDRRARFSMMSLELDAVGISIVANDPEAMRLAIRAGVPGTIRYQPKIGSGYRTSLLHMASAYGDRALVKAVIQAFGGVDTLDSRGRGVLMAAIDNPSDACGVARVLLEAGADGSEQAIQYAEIANKTDLSACIREAMP